MPSLDERRGQSAQRSAGVRRKRRKPIVRQQPSLDQRRGQSTQRAAPARREARQRQAVARERRRVQQGTGLRAETRDVTRRTRRPSAREEMRAALADLGAPRRRLTAPPRTGLDAALHAVGSGISGLGEFIGNAPLIQTGGGPAGALNARSGRRRGGGGAVLAAGLAPKPGQVRDVPLLHAALRDLVDFPRNAVLGGYEVGAAGVEAAGGDSARARRLAQGLTEGVVGQLAQGKLAGAARAFEEHPLYGALEVTGTGQILGRGAGAASRSGALGRRAARRQSTRREPLRVEGTDLSVGRRYSPNVIVAEVQRAAERSQRSRGLDPNVARGRKRENLIAGEVDEFAAQAEGIRRRGRVEAVREAQGLAPARTAGRLAPVQRARDRGLEASSVPGTRGRAERDVVLAAVEGRLRGPETFRADLRRERDRLQQVYVRERKEMSASARRENREQVRSLDRVLGDPKALANAPAVFRAADEYNAAAGKLEGALIRKRALDPEQARTARLRTYGVAVMGLRPNPEGKGLVDADGRQVSPDEIAAHIKATGGREPGFVGQRRSDRGASSYFVNWWGSGRKTVDSKRRTGEAARTGAYDASFRALEEQLVRGRGVADAIGTFDAFIGRFGSRRRDGKPYTWDEAERTAQEKAEATGMEWVPMRAVPARYDARTRESILESQGSATAPGHLDSLTVGRLDDSLRPPEGKETQARNVVLVPAQAVSRFREHQTSGSGAAAKAGQAVTRAFRGAVLPFSVKWLTGNVAEAVLRSAAHGITPVDIARGGRVMRELRKLDEETWRQADTRIRGGLLYGSGERLNVRRAGEDFEGTKLATPAKALELTARVPVVRQILGGLRVYQRSVFALNRGFERAMQQGVIGKSARVEAQELTGSWGQAIRMQESVAREVASGLLFTERQVQFARMADEVLGKYSRFSPGTRRVIQTFSPFLPWALNAVRFSFYTLPAKHPVKTALLANVETTIQQDILEQREQTPPGSLQSAIRREDGGYVDVARYTPFGIATEGAGVVPQFVLPQISGVVAILRGQSWTGKPLRGRDKKPPGEDKRLWLALNSLAEATVPGLTIARRLREGGGTPTDDSTVFSPATKPGTKRTSAVERIVNPVRPVYLRGGGTGSSSPTDAAAQREAQSIVRERVSAGERRALEREARAILREQGVLP